MSISLAIACLALNGCTDPLEQRTTQEVQGQFERGVTGQGSLGPLERPPGDPAAEHRRPADSSVALKMPDKPTHSKILILDFGSQYHPGHRAANPRVPGVFRDYPFRHARR